MKLSFVVPGPPKPWQRAASRNGKRFTPKSMREYQADVAESASAALCAAFEPRTWPESSRFAVTITVTPKTAVRADIDNYAKTVLDSCNRILWVDDSQVDVLHVQRSAPDKANPFLAVTVEVIGGA